MVRGILLAMCVAAPVACRATSPELPSASAAAFLAAPPAPVSDARARFPEGEVFVAACSVAPAEPWSYALLGDEVVHAASTMKVPVLVTLHRAAAQGHLALDDELLVKVQFASIVDGSPYSLSADDDSDPELYDHVGTELPLHELARRMVVRSSNLATNLLVERLGAGEIQRTIEALGTTRMRVLRGVEDGKAFAAGLSNTATAVDLARLMATIAEGRAVSAEHSARMLDILEAQEHDELIPAGLPPGTRVAHKTGTITGILHDAAIVLPAGESPYVLVVLTRGFADPARARGAIRAIARAAHDTRPGRTVSSDPPSDARRQ